MEEKPKHIMEVLAYMTSLCNARKDLCREDIETEIDNIEGMLYYLESKGHFFTIQHPRYYGLKRALLYHNIGS